MRVWLLRGTLASLLLLGAEVLVWLSPPSRPLWEWPLLIAGYVLLACALLDVLVRYRLRDLYSMALLAGLCACAAAVMQNPQTGLSDLPRTLVTRVMGAHALIALEMLYLFVALTSARPTWHRWAWLLAVPIGAAWGVWLRWSPLLTDFRVDGLVPPLESALLWCGAGVALALLLAWLAGRGQPLDLSTTLLNTTGWLIVGSSSVVLVLIRILLGQVDFGGLAACALLMVFCVAILWFLRRPRGRVLYGGELPAHTPALLLIVPTLVIFVGVAVFGYSLPLIGQLEAVNQVAIVTVGFTAYGLGWLPSVALILGGRAIERFSQTGKL
jgi:hypothetical protein